MTAVPPPGPHGGDAAAVALALGLDPGGVLDLSQSLNPVAPDPAAVLERHLGAVRCYPDPRRATAALAEAMGVDGDRLLLTNGGAEAIALVAEVVGGRVVEPEFSLHPRGSGPLWRSDPHNPSGRLAPPGARADVWDEAFYPLATGRWTAGRGGAVVVGSLTKLLACPGLRVGYVLGPPGDGTVVDRCRRLQPAWSVNGLAASALPELLGQVRLEEWCALTAALRQALVAVLVRHGLDPLPSDANWVLVEAPGLRDRLAPEGVVVRDCSSFGMPGTVRIAVPPADGLDRLDRALSAVAATPHGRARWSARDVAGADVASGPGAPSPAEQGRQRKARQETSDMTSGEFEAARQGVTPVDASVMAAATEYHDRLTKPRGALGRLEELGVRLCGIAGACPPPVPEPVVVAVFAGDHGVVAEGVTPWPQEVTAQMVANFCDGGAAINVLARHAGAEVVVVDVGVATPIPTASGRLLRRTIRHGTRDLAEEAAMTAEETAAALDVGAEVAVAAVADGAGMLVTGDMGIGNTTPSAALIAALTGLAPDRVTGRGTGVDDVMLARKVQVVERALARVPAGAAPLVLLSELGGLEIAALCGFVVGGAARGVPVVVDGVIALAAALVAAALVPDVAGYLVAGHRSTEPGADAALERLGLTPVLDLGMRLGEGSGAVLSVPVVQAAARILGEMATFDAAGVTDKGDPRR